MTTSGMRRKGSYLSIVRNDWHSEIGDTGPPSLKAATSTLCADINATQSENSSCFCWDGAAPDLRRLSQEIEHFRAIFGASRIVSIQALGRT
jgi:hypothetical protein